MSLNDSTKKQLLEAAIDNLTKISKKIEDMINNSKQIQSYHKNYKADTFQSAARAAVRSEDILVNIENYKLLLKSPYFSRSDIVIDGDAEIKTFYFAKFPFIEENIYSWVAPAAKMRFEDIGDFNFETVNGNFLKGKILRKDQFMIVDGKIIFMASESADYERALIHQEFLSNRKSAGFAMQDIVSMMEKAQDKVIRADSKGSFLISGPAGSGKTTLALHRVAFLTQSPETSPLYPGEKIIVFVQDSSTKEYFSALLPNLGIENVKITTFADWACEILKLEIINYELRIGETEEEKDIYEFEKNSALKNLEDLKIDKNYFKTLQIAYSDYLSESSKKHFKKQISDRKFDRFDLTILLKAYLNKEKALHEEYIDYVQVKRGKIDRRIAKEKLDYSLIIIDETQNYLAEQIEIIKSTVNQKTKSILFVGDLVQQTHLGTIRDWNEVGEIFDNERKAELDKVYRNTKQILEFIKTLGYKVNSSENLRDGIEVKEAILENIDEEINYICKVIEEKKDDVIGILVKTPKQKEIFQILVETRLIASLPTNIKLMTINESQGVEFDIVILAGIEKAIFNVDYSSIEETQNLSTLRQEKQKVNKDLIYVALTRAMNELHIIGKNRLSEIR